MDNQQKVKSFEKELMFIRDETVRKFAIACIEFMPDYFFVIPASSTGKYHPAYSLGEGGLLRHTRAAIRIAVELFRLDWWHFTPEEQDLLLAAIIPHDGWKSGVNKSEFTVADHPIIAVNQLFSNPSVSDILTREQFQFVADCISTHMGQWNRDYRTKQEILEKPQTKYQKFVHLADYLASRKCLEMNFDVEISKE